MRRMCVETAIAETITLSRVDAELRLARVQLLRALRVEESLDPFAFADIVDDLVSRIEALELARHVVRITARLARGVVQ